MARNSIAPGGYIGGEPPRRPSFNQLSGVWKLDDVLERQKNNQWTNVLGVEDVFSTWLYAGTGATQTITNGINLSGQGGLAWIKSRSDGNANNTLIDTARGATRALFTDSTSLESTASNRISSFNSNGFTVETSAVVNGSGRTYASWTFRRTAKFFDVVTYTGTGAASSVNHNLGSIPGVIIIKRIDSAADWIVYHRSTGTGRFLYLNATDAAIASSKVTATDSSTFSLVADANVNASGGSFVAYLFAHDAGGFGDSGNESVVKCGSYTGNGSTSGPVIDLGWEPQWLMIKRTDVTGGWFIFDSLRGITTGGNDPYVRAESTAAEFATANEIRLESTGFGINTTSGSINASGGSFVYIAIRRGPMKAPTSGTQVFAANRVTPSTGNSFNTGFSVDLSIANAASNGIIGLFQDRLRGYPTVSSTAGNYPLLVSTMTNAESSFNNSSPYIWGADSNADIKYGANLGGLLNTTYAFRRAPGFFDIVAYTGTGVARTVAHSLGVAPELIISKNRTISQTWFVYSAHISFGNALALNDSSPASAYNIWSSAPSSSLIYLTDNPNGNRTDDNYIAYLFASCPGVSKVGSYTGTGTTLDIDCGFTNGARFVLIKRINGTSDWYVWDSARGIVSGNDPYLLLNSTAAEVTNTDFIDPLSTGFQISSTAPAAINVSGGTFLFLAIA